MAMAENRDEFDHLDRFLDTAARSVPVSDSLMHRVLADAERIDRARRPASVWHQLREALGGWSGFGGLVAASLAGLWIGFAPPAMLPDPAAFLMGSDASVETDFWDTGVFDTAAILGEG